MNNDLLRRLLIDEEGIEFYAYKDSKGVWHIGIGHNLEIDQTEDELAVLGLFYDDFVKEWENNGDPTRLQISEQQAYNLFDIDVQDAIEDIANTFDESFLESLGETRRAVILSMVFQLGGGGIRKFKNFIAAVKASDWNTAADEMLFANVATQRQSAWYRQTPDRCQRAANAMRTGYFKRYQTPFEDSPTDDKIDLSTVSDAELITELYNRLVKGV